MKNKQLQTPVATGGYIIEKSGTTPLTYDTFLVKGNRI